MKDMPLPVLVCLTVLGLLPEPFSELVAYCKRGRPRHQGYEQINEDGKTSTNDDQTDTVDGQRRPSKLHSFSFHPSQMDRSRGIVGFGMFVIVL